MPRLAVTDSLSLARTARCDAWFHPPDTEESAHELQKATTERNLPAPLRECMLAVPYLAIKLSMRLQHEPLCMVRHVLCSTLLCSLLRHVREREQSCFQNCMMVTAGTVRRLPTLSHTLYRGNRKGAGGSSTLPTTITVAMLSDAQRSASRLNLERAFLSGDEVDGIFSGRIGKIPSAEKTVPKLVITTTQGTSAPLRARVRATW